MADEKKKPTKRARRKPISPATVLSDILKMPGLETQSPPPGPAPPSALVPEYKFTPAPEKLRQIVANPPPRPSTQAFLDHWFAIRGGPAQFALDLCREYDAAEPGSLVRTQIIQVVMRSMKVTDGKEGSHDDLGMVSDADLEKMLTQLGAKLLADADRQQQGAANAAGS